MRKVRIVGNNISKIVTMFVGDKVIVNKEGTKEQLLVLTYPDEETGVKAMIDGKYTDTVKVEHLPVEKEKEVSQESVSEGGDLGINVTDETKAKDVMF